MRQQPDRANLPTTLSAGEVAAIAEALYRQVATRRYIDEQPIWTPMRFADEPVERAPSRQASRGAGRGGGVGKGEFDRGIERLNDAAVDEGDGRLQDFRDGHGWA
jgi:hypothetical protein